MFLEGASHGEDVVQGDHDTQGTAHVLKDSLQTKHNFAKCLRVNAQVANILNCGSSSSHTRGRNFQAFLFQGKPVPQKLNRIFPWPSKGICLNATRSLNYVRMNLLVYFPLQLKDYVTPALEYSLEEMAKVPILRLNFSTC